MNNIKNIHKETERNKLHEELNKTGLFDIYIEYLYTRCVLRKKPKYYFMIFGSNKVHKYWVGSPGRRVSFEEVFQSCSDDLKKKLAFHFDILDF